MILDCPNCFGRVQIVLVWSKSFWSGSNQDFLDYFYNLDPSKMIGTRKKPIWTIQFFFYLYKDKALDLTKRGNAFKSQTKRWNLHV